MIFIDASRYNNTAYRTGVENYSYHLINEMIHQAKDEITLIAPKKVNIDIPQITIPFPRLWTQIRLSLEVFWNKKLDNIFVPSHLLPLITPKKSTITIHDVAWKHVPEGYSFLSKIYLEWGTKFAVRNAKNIIVPSQQTKDDLVNLYNADESKIHVIPLGYIRVSNQERLISNVKKEPYFIFVGRIEYKKNTDTLIKAFHKFCEADKEAKLVLVGKVGHGGKEILANIPNEIRNRIEITGYVSDEEKNELMQNALAFVFPSRYEGFGIPLLEAMDYNLPIIASNIPTSREVAGESALYFDADNTETLSILMQQIKADGELRKQMIKEGQEILSKYSWQKAANDTLKVLNK